MTVKSRGYLLLSAFAIAVVGCRSYPWSPESLPQNPLQSQALFSSPEDAAPKVPATTDKKVSKKEAEQEAAFVRSLTQGRSLERLGKLDEARKIYEKLIVQFPDRYEPYHRLAVVSDRQMRYLEAEALYAQAIRLNPTDPDLFNDLGYCYLLQGKSEKAERALLKAIGMAPASQRYRNNLGLAYGLQGRYQEALEQFRRAGGEADAWYNLAYVQWMRNDLDLSQQSLENAIAVNPGHTAARECLSRVSSGEAFFADTVPNTRPWNENKSSADTELAAVGDSTSSGTDRVTQTTFEMTRGTLRLGLKDRPSTQTQLDVARSSWARRIQQESIENFSAFSEP
ncbi:MAG: tetratricopeptide repeat protein [Thermogutta sp.]